MNQKIKSYVPKTKIEAIKDAYKDEDGYWICLNEGWEASRTDCGCRTIHEDTIKDLRYQIAGIQRVINKDPDPELKEIQDSMTESFYEFCTGEPIPENWHEIVAEEKEGQLPQISSAAPLTPAKSSPSAAEAVGFGVCMALAYTAWIAKEAAELLILALQVAYVALLPIVLRVSERLWRAWVRIYPEIVPTACKTARIAAKQAAVVVWWLWIVIA